jgi:ABC-type transport system involved in multi-copper enzyme maturation permease subunit
MADLGLAAIELAAVAVALFAGSTLLSREIERQTCLLVLAKPVSRQVFLLAKGLGLTFLLTTLVGALTILLGLLLGRADSFVALGAVGFSIWCKALILLGWTLFAGVWIRPVLNICMGVAIYLLGHWLSDLAFFAKDAEKDWDSAVAVLRWVTPNFDRFNWKSHYFIVNPPLAQDLAGTALHTAAWLLILLWLGGLSFSRRDIV